MSRQDGAERKWNAQYYAALQGATVVSVDGGAEFPRFTVRTPAGEEFVCEVSRDEEGNGPGFLFGLPTPVFDQPTRRVR